MWGLIWFIAQEPPNTTTGVQVVDWIFKAGLPGFFGYGWWDATRERRAVQEKNDERQERMIPVFVEFTGVLKELKEIVLERRDLERAHGPDAAAMNKLSRQLDDLTDEFRSGGRDDPRDKRRRDGQG